MQLRFLGTGAAFYPALGNNGAFFACGDDLFLIDCGETAFSTLMRADLLPRYPGAITVLLTHLHADHCGSLGTLALYAAQVLGRPLTIVHPDAERLYTLLELMGARREQVRLLSALDERGVRATPGPTRHAPSMPAYAYLLSMDGETVYYSGDSGELPEDIIGGVREGRIIHAYQDTFIYDKAPDSPPHVPLAELAARLEPALRSKFTLMHVNRDFRAEAEALGFAWAERDAIFA